MHDPIVVLKLAPDLVSASCQHPRRRFLGRKPDGDRLALGGIAADHLASPVDGHAMALDALEVLEPAEDPLADMELDLDAVLNPFLDREAGRCELFFCEPGQVHDHIGATRDFEGELEEGDVGVERGWRIF